MSRDPDPLAETHFQRNRVTRGDWDDFASHRERVTEAILAAGDGTLCVLGAGNGNDLDLARLSDHFDRITLVDLDSEALDHCLASQGKEISERITTVAGVDLSGILDSLGDGMVETIGRAGHPTGLNLAKHDVVVSTCLLTQMIDSVANAIGPDDPRFVELVLALRDGHLQLLLDLTHSGGTALLITDLVSSSTLPQLAGVPEEQLESLLARAIADRNFFTGVNPGVLARQFGLLGGGTPEIHRPWRWMMGNRTYAVCAISIAHAAGSSAEP